VKRLALLLFFILPFAANAQFPTLSEKAEISIITVGPGKYLYDCFGHNAFRIKDPALNLDQAYNFGTYNFDEGVFYWKFSRGIAQYRLAVRDYDKFENYYIRSNRWIKEQVLNLNQEQKQAIYNALETNNLPQNQYYRYDPFFDNCATKMRDVVKDVLGDDLILSDSHITDKATIRDLVDENAFNHLWIDMGIDFALGTILDQEATNEIRMYLPDYIFAGFNNATIKTDSAAVAAVKATNIIYDNDYYEQPKESLAPWIVFAVIAVIVIVFTFRDYSQQKRARFMDFTIMFITGLLGLVVLLLWFATYHSTTVNNLNVLWAFAPNLVLAFYVVKKNPPQWVRSYVRFLFILLVAMSFAWIAQLQDYNTALIPIMVLLGTRYVFLWNKGLITKP